MATVWAATRRLSPTFWGTVENVKPRSRGCGFKVPGPGFAFGWSGLRLVR